MEKVYVYKNTNGDYRVHPGVVVLGGGIKLRVINTTSVALKVVMPAGASKPHDPVEVEIPSEDQDDIGRKGREKPRAIRTS